MRTRTSILKRRCGFSLLFTLFFSLTHLCSEDISSLLNEKDASFKKWLENTKSQALTASISPQLTKEISASFSALASATFSKFPRLRFRSDVSPKYLSSISNEFIDSTIQGDAKKENDQKYRKALAKFYGMALAYYYRINITQDQRTAYNFMLSAVVSSASRSYGLAARDALSPAQQQKYDDFFTDFNNIEFYRKSQNLNENYSTFEILSENKLLPLQDATGDYSKEFVKRMKATTNPEARLDAISQFILDVRGCAGSPFYPKEIGEIIDQCTR